MNQLRRPQGRKEEEVVNSTVLSSDWVLDYEIRLSTRHRRFVSFVLIGSDTDCRGVGNVLSETIRSTDTSFRESDAICIVMGETGYAEAIEAIRRYKETIDGSMNVHFSLASYPKDGKTSEELRAAARNRLDKARSLGCGAVVSEG